MKKLKQLKEQLAFVLYKQLAFVLYKQQSMFPHPEWFKEEKRLIKEIKKLEEKLKK